MNASTSPTETIDVRRPILPYKWIALVTVASGNLFASISMTIINISLPSITQSFESSLAVIQWVIAIYPLITVSIMLAVGYLGDVFGRKRIFTIGAVVFAIGSLLCGLSPSPWYLIGFRVVQALGGAMVLSTSAALVTDAFPAKERGKALGLQSMTASIGMAIGPTVGGVLVDTLGWRWIFFLSVPMCLLTAILSILLLREQRLLAAKSQQLDIFGTIVLFVTLTTFLLALSEGQENGWTSPLLVLLSAVCLLSFALFIMVERRAALPSVDLGLLRSRLFATASATGLMAFATVFGVSFLTPFYLTGTVGYAAAEAGLILAAFPLAMATIGPIAGWLSDRFGSRGLCSSGMAFCAIGVFMLAGLGETTDWLSAGTALLIFGIGLGLFMSPNNSAIMGSIPIERSGMASAISATVRHLGSALGIAIAATVFSIRIVAYGGSTSAGAFSSLDQVASSLAFHDTYMVLGILCSLGVLTSLVRGSKG